MRTFGKEISGNRLRGSELTNSQRVALISKREEGATYPELAAEFGCSESCAYRTCKRWKEYGTLNSLPRSGRPKSLSPNEERRLFRTARKYPKIKYQELVIEAGLKAEPTLSTPTRRTTLSHSTLYRTLRKRGLAKRRCKKRPKLLAEHAKLRRGFSHKYRYFNWARRRVRFST
jgi:transposase